MIILTSLKSPIPMLMVLENMSENRSHRNGMPGKDDILDIKQDMRNFMNRGK